MTLSFRTVAAAAVLLIAPLAHAHAQDAFAPAEPGGATSGAEAPEGKVVRLDGAAVSGQSLYRVLARSNAAWLANRGPYEYPLRSHVVVYRDGVVIGGVEALRKIPAGEVAEVKHMTAAEADRQFGIEHGAGALILTSR
jgi:hypothetical protein